MRVIDISIEIFRELSEPTDISPTLISLWLRENIGSLNNAIDTSYTIDITNAEISPELGENEKSIFKQLYNVYYWDKKVRAALASADSNSVVEVSEGGATVRLLNKNEMAKTYAAMRKEEKISLDKMIMAYKINGASPSQVSGKDVTEGIFSADETERGR